MERRLQFELDGNKYVARQEGVTSSGGRNVTIVEATILQRRSVQHQPGKSLTLVPEMPVQPFRNNTKR